MAKRWYIVHAYSNFEKKVAEEIKKQALQHGLADLFEEVLVPTEEVVEIRRDPGLLRAQFACWTEAREWLGSTIRPGFMRRTIEMWTGGKPLRLVPTLGFCRGWRVVGTKSGLVAEAKHGLLSRSATLCTYRKIDLELLVFAYFIGGIALWESALPTSLESVDRAAPATARG